MEFRHPKYYKKLRMQYGPHKAISDSKENSEAASVRPGSRPQAPSLKQVIQETVPQCDIEEATSSQAPSSKPQAPSRKLQASSRKRQAP